MSEELKMAIAAVQRHGLEPFEKVARAIPATLSGRAYERWIERQARETARASARLTKSGAVIEITDRAALITIAGIEAMSTLGFYQALKNWNGKACKAMRAFNRGARP
tara:strand:+ start:168 stop:491 length:324 start_codon:yes stop_codon:yes gene_type:complete